MKVKLVCRRKQPYLKLISNWGADKVMNKRKIWQNRICPTLERRERKAKLLKGETDNTEEESTVQECSRARGDSAVQLRGRMEQHREGEGGSVTESFTETDWRENKVKTQVKTEQASRRLEQIARVSLRPSRAIQGPREKPDWISQLGERSLNQNSWVVEPSS